MLCERMRHGVSERSGDGMGGVVQWLWRGEGNGRALKGHERAKENSLSLAEPHVILICAGLIYLIMTQLELQLGPRRSRGSLTPGKMIHRGLRLEDPYQQMGLLDLLFTFQISYLFFLLGLFVYLFVCCQAAAVHHTFLHQDEEGLVYSRLDESVSSEINATDHRNFA